MKILCAWNNKDIFGFFSLIIRFPDLCVTFVNLLETRRRISADECRLNSRPLELAYSICISYNYCRCQIYDTAIGLTLVYSIH